MNVYINKIAKFLPNDPVDNDDMESYLGMVDGKPSMSRSIILRRNGIKQRYYALDKEGKVTHTNSHMAANAIRNLCDDKFSLRDITLLACGTASPEQLVPSHGVMVHGELNETANVEVVSFAGSCCTGGEALKYACMAVEIDPLCNAVVSASERLSAWMRASYFQKESEYLSKLDKQPFIAFEKDFLRWMLSDGAYAALVQGRPNNDAPSLRVEWIEVTSYANLLETCMYVGAEKDETGALNGWSMYPQEEWLTKSLFAVKQDTRMLADHIVRLGTAFLIHLSKKHHFSPADIDWFLPHLSSMYFKSVVMKEFEDKGFVIPEERWFLNLPYIGNIASASAFAMLEELLYSGRLKKGERILVHIPESARFSFCCCMLTVI